MRIRRQDGEGAMIGHKTYTLILMIIAGHEKGSASWRNLLDDRCVANVNVLARFTYMWGHQSMNRHRTRRAAFCCERGPARVSRLGEVITRKRYISAKFCKGTCISRLGIGNKRDVLAPSSILSDSILPKSWVERLIERLLTQRYSWNPRERF